MKISNRALPNSNGVHHNEPVHQDESVDLDEPVVRDERASRNKPVHHDEPFERVYLSPPHMSGREQEYVQDAFDSNWIAPIGPHIDRFEEEFCATVGARYALAVSSGTAALHLALQLAGVGQGDEVFVSTLTFIGSVNPVIYLGARPVFVDSERRSWNMDPDILAEALKRRANIGRLPKAVVLVHLYGQSANIDPILEVCNRYDVALIEDAAEALGTTYKQGSPGTYGLAGIYSFNGNKIITTSGGGMLVSEDEDFIRRARKYATQARDEAAHYQHSEIGYNYRMSNVLAGIGRAQLQVLEERVSARRRIFEMYRRALCGVPGVEFMPEASWGRHNRWLTTLTIDPNGFGANREDVRVTLAARNIEARPVWKPMHLQPVFLGCERWGGNVAANLFQRGLCLPSGSSMKDSDVAAVIETIHELHHRRA